ncbi:hypothetical protein [Pleionea sp. CnH1-48]|uniref:hypothetical protein n=1 Tax=Pleionea sp. CnH1-48 TaxID=2954494 RepID=UPI002097A88C|nr:hypothetical protein [Pleionea sp. CnH1-48]MCO7226187.1 hypothetical protein [Pleionea sp. CnH1-48]
MFKLPFLIYQHITRTKIDNINQLISMMKDELIPLDQEEIVKEALAVHSFHSVTKMIVSSKLRKALIIFYESKECELGWHRIRWMKRYLSTDDGVNLKIKITLLDRLELFMNCVLIPVILLVLSLYIGDNIPNMSNIWMQIGSIFLSAVLIALPIVFTIPAVALADAVKLKRQLEDRAASNDIEFAK